MLADAAPIEDFAVLNKTLLPPQVERKHEQSKNTSRCLPSRVSIIIGHAYQTKTQVQIPHITIHQRDRPCVHS
jgi:hypothetical protein